MKDTTSRSTGQECSMPGCSEPPDFRDKCTSHRRKCGKVGCPKDTSRKFEGISYCHQHYYAISKHDDLDWICSRFSDPGLQTRVCRTCSQEKFNHEMVRHSQCVDQVTNQCKECKSKYDAEYREANREKRRESNRRRKSVMRGAAAEVINPDVLWERDDGICKICDSTIDRELAYPDPMSPSIDHIIPISAGGVHTYANTRVAHLFCNLVKGTSTEPNFKIDLPNYITQNQSRGITTCQFQSTATNTELSNTHTQSAIE